MELIDRYVYAVVSRLPEKQRGDIEREIRTLIEDVMAKYSPDEPEQIRIEKAIMEIGDPAILAENYLERKRYLIGPQNFDKYSLVLKVVLGAILIGVSVAAALGGLFSVEQSLINAVAVEESLAKAIIEYLTSLTAALMQGFVWVTLIFAIAESKGVKLGENRDRKKGWDLADLPVIPSEKARISRVETIIGMFFTTLFVLTVCFLPHLIASYIKQPNGQVAVIPVFNLEVVGNYRGLFLTVFILTMTKEVLKLAYGRWSSKLSVGYSILSAASLILLVIIFKNTNLWNCNYGIEVSRYMNAQLNFDLGWKQLANGVLIGLVAVYSLDIGVALYKGFTSKPRLRV